MVAWIITSKYLLLNSNEIFRILHVSDMTSIANTNNKFWRIRRVQRQADSYHTSSSPVNLFSSAIVWYQQVHLQHTYSQQNYSQKIPIHSICSNRFIHDNIVFDNFLLLLNNKLSQPIIILLVPVRNTNLRAGLPKYRQKSAYSLCGYTNYNGK